MAQVPGFQAPDLPPVKRSNNSVIWVVVIVALAAFCVVALLVGAAVLLPVFSQAKFAAQTSACLSEIKQLNLGIQLYVADNDGNYPAANDWYTRATASSGKRFQCPMVAKDDPKAVGFALNKALAGLPDAKVADRRETVLVFESLDLGENVAGGPELIPIPGRHGSGNSRSSTFGFADGGARRVNTGIAPGRWNP